VACGRCLLGGKTGVMVFCQEWGGSVSRRDLGSPLWLMAGGVSVSCPQAGCCFMKLGQWISMRPDMFPADVVRAMARLRSGVPPHPFEATREAIRESFGKDIDEMFEHFENEAIASGTVAQVGAGGGGVGVG
jgi:hypothetical protein